MAGAGAALPPKSEAAAESKEHKKAKKSTKDAKDSVPVKEAAQPDECDDSEEESLGPEAQPAFPRSEVDKADVKVRSNAIHVYGLDFLQTGHMDEIFSQFKHKWIEWINDSSANIVFGDAPLAKRALESLSFPKAGDEPWRRTPDILVSEDVPPIYLQMRYATLSDVKPSKKAVPKAAAPRQPRKPVQGRTKQRPRPEEEEVAGGNLLRGGPAALDRALEPAGVRGRGGGGAEGVRKRKAPTQPSAVSGKIPLTEEELAKRQKRAARFGEPESAPTAVVDPAAAAAAREEELARRRKREARFGDPPGDKPAQKPAEKPADKPADKLAEAKPAADKEAA